MKKQTVQVQTQISKVGHGQGRPPFILGLRAALLSVPKLDPSLSPFLHSFPSSFSELQANDIDEDAWVGVRH